MYLIINKWVTAVKVSNFSGQYLRNHRTLDIGVLGYIGIVWPKEHFPVVRSFPPGIPCIYLLPAVSLTLLGRITPVWYYFSIFDKDHKLCSFSICTPVYPPLWSRHSSHFVILPPFMIFPYGIFCFYTPIFIHLFINIKWCYIVCLFIYALSDICSDSKIIYCFNLFWNTLFKFYDW